jgi:hypothetical protein
MRLDRNGPGEVWVLSWLWPLGLILMWIYFSDGRHFGLVVTCENGKIEASTLNCAW